MKFSTKSRYALRLMIDLAQQDSKEYISLKDVSKRQEISLKYLEQIVAPLARAGLIVSSRGSRGGHRLTRPASAFTVGEIIRAIEGTISPVACLGEESPPCPRAATCDTLDFWVGLKQTINRYLDGKTLAELAGDPGKRRRAKKDGGGKQ